MPSSVAVPGVGDVGQAVVAQERELEVVPVTPEDAPLKRRRSFAQHGLPADLVVSEEVRLVGRERAAAIDAAGTETFGPAWRTP